MTNPTGDSPVSLEVIEGTFDLARQGRTGPLGEMIDAGVPIDVRNPRGDTVLIVATYAEQEHTVADLVRRGADLNALNAAGQTAISCAVFRKNETLLRMLLDAGADPDAGPLSAIAITEQFALPEMRTILDEYAGR
ncbi:MULTISPECIES: ankyrin repeat domain-containing protein [Microbacterium]|uniref:Ankyrin repeat domain-containing protein n=1 Tax=Microbacterium profundi TaxID=450380 RepID=A0ABV3LHL1_9MICO|nr:ankyrin repeat domain-containing protein [Microbacterium profundi]MCE7482751.1 ankyrin repeat domain-containing protein [Microbacterium profundi]